MHSGNSLESHTRFQTKILKWTKLVYRFQTETASKTTSGGDTYLYALYQEYPSGIVYFLQSTRFKATSFITKNDMDYNRTPKNLQ